MAYDNHAGCFLWEIKILLNTLPVILSPASASTLKSTTLDDTQIREHERQPTCNPLKGKEIHVDFPSHRPKSPIILLLQIGKQKYKSKAYPRTEVIKWDSEIYVLPASRIVLRILRGKKKLWKILAKDFIAELAFTTSDEVQAEKLMDLQLDQHMRVQVRFIYAEKVDRKFVVDLLGKTVSSAFAGKVVLLDRVQNLSSFVKLVLEVGSAFSELSSPAKIVFSLANMVFSALQEQQEFHHTVVDFVELLQVKLHLSDIIPENLQQGSVRVSLREMLNVIEKALRFIMECMNTSSLDVLTSRRGEIAKLRATLFATSENLTHCLAANIFVMISDMHLGLLSGKLRPVLAARSSDGHCCLEGTRKKQIEQLISWAKKSDTGPALYHMYGVAGIGKSSIAATVCEKLEEEKLLGGAFHCRRDTPDQRDPARILPSLSYTLALRHKPYRECLLRSLEDEPDITSRSIEHQLKILFRRPLTELHVLQGDVLGQQPFVFVVDALDECGDEATRTRIANCFRQIVSLADWLKIFVTSRPLDELMKSFARSDSLKVSTVDLNIVDAESDIKSYTRASLEELVDQQGLDPKWLNEKYLNQFTELASGLFIWTSTMIRFIRDQFDKDWAMTLVLSGKAASAEARLDSLYLKIIESGNLEGMNFVLKKAVLGITLVTSRNCPLSVDGLYEFLRGSAHEITKPTLKAIIRHLGSVLYEDTSKGNVIRVCHPSFLDFLENPERCSSYWTSLDQLHSSMITTSLNLMSSALRFNICNLKKSYTPNSDVPDLGERIKSCMAEALQYSCLYWMTHLTDASRETAHILIIGFIRSVKVIYWLEVLSLIDGLRNGLDALQNLAIIYKDDVTTCVLVKDLYRLVSSSFEAISHSTPHLYISALAWLPEESSLRQIIRPHFMSDLFVVTGRNKHWQSTLWVYGVGDYTCQAVFSPDNNYVAACSNDGSIVVLEVKTGVLWKRFRGHYDEVLSVAFSPSGQRFVSSSSDESVIIWDLLSGELVCGPLTGHTDAATSVEYSPDGRYIASRSFDKTVRIWDSESGIQINMFDGCSLFGRLTYSPDGKRIACCGEEGIIVRDVQTGELCGRVTDIGHVLDIAYSPDNKIIAASSEERNIYVWNAETFAELAVLKEHEGGILSVSFSPDGSELITAGKDRRIVQWDVVSFDMIGFITPQESAFYSVAFSPDGQLVASASWDGLIRVWNTRTLFGDCISACLERPWSIACSPNGQEFASSTRSGRICIHDAMSGKVLHILDGHSAEVNTLSYSPNGTLLASGSDDLTVRVWDTASNLELHKFVGHSALVRTVIFSHNGTQIFSGSYDGTVRRWDIESMNDEGSILIKHDAEVKWISLSPDGALLASGGRDNLIRFSSPENGEEIGDSCSVETPINGLSFSPDGRYFASCSEDDKQIRLWSSQTRREVRKFVGHDYLIYSVVFSQDGNHLLSASADNTVREWCVETGAELRKFVGHTIDVACAVYSMNDERVISGSHDGTIRIWKSGSSSCEPIVKGGGLTPTSDGWIKSEIGELILWIPSEYRNGVKDMCEICIPADASNHPVRLDWAKLPEGRNWADVLIQGELEDGGCS